MLNSYNYSYSSLTFNILHHIFLFPAGTAAVNIRWFINAQHIFHKLNQWFDKYSLKLPRREAATPTARILLLLIIHNFSLYDFHPGVELKSSYIGNSISMSRFHCNIHLSIVQEVQGRLQDAESQHADSCGDHEGGGVGIRAILLTLGSKRRL